jgi:hypothetical protein
MYNKVPFNYNIWLTATGLRLFITCICIEESQTEPLLYYTPHNSLNENEKRNGPKVVQRTLILPFLKQQQVKKEIPKALHAQKHPFHFMATETFLKSPSWHTPHCPVQPAAHPHQHYHRASYPCYPHPYPRQTSS